MHIKILGTAAAEGIPSIYCGCPTCTQARVLGGRNLRSRSSAVFGGKHLIDLSPDIWYHANILGLNTVDLENLFITHPHFDHFSFRELHWLCPGFSSCHPKPLNVHGNKTVVERASSVLGDHVGKVATLHELEPFTPVTVDDYTFTPVIALHMQDDLCFNYVVQSGGWTALYACDVGEYPEETWDFLKTHAFDVVISECTSGPLGGGNAHMSYEKVYGMKKRLEEMASFSDGMYVLTHFSHNAGVLHDEIAACVESEGIQVAYDGMEIDI